MIMQITKLIRMMFLAITWHRNSLEIIMAIPWITLKSIFNSKTTRHQSMIILIINRKVCNQKEWIIMLRAIYSNSHLEVCYTKDQTWAHHLVQIITNHIIKWISNTKDNNIRGIQVAVDLIKAQDNKFKCSNN